MINDKRVKKKVLVFPCGSEIGLEIYRSLRFSTYFDLVGGSSVADHGQYVYQSYVDDIPFVDDPNFIPAIKQIVSDYKIDFIFPAHDSVVLKLAEHQSEVGAVVVTSPVETCRIARSKQATYQRLGKMIRVPRQYLATGDSPLPVFLKPDVGQGSKGAILAKTSAAVGVALERDPSLLILEYLPGEEFTVDCFTDRHGQLLFAQARTRSRIVNGISVHSEIVKDDEFTKIAEAINQALTFRGVWFFQVKRADDGILALLEIAPRVAGTMALSRIRGVNLPLLSLFDQMDLDVTVKPNSFSAEVDRALESKFKLNLTYETVYIDLDDTIIVKQQVNYLLMALIYKLRNEGKKIILITKHRADVAKTLTQHNIALSLFSSVITLEQPDYKQLHISANSIFIDDSFVERTAVLEHSGIPVFDVSEAVELL
ncbi:MAG: ATP-grasp domain-containing protein [Patescibacteria group bacterium]